MSIDKSIRKARKSLLSKQKTDGYWQFPLEADCTMPSEYVLLQHFLGNKVVNKIQLASYLCDKQNPGDGGWPLYNGGPSDLSCSVKAYYALKLLGVEMHSARLDYAREFILSAGGAAKANVFTRIMLAMYRQVPWDSIPWQPIELILLPKWCPFSLHRVAYWSRCVMIPLSVLVSNKATADNPDKVSVGELFLKNPWGEQDYFPDVKGFRSRLILKTERFLRKHLAPRISERTTHLATAKATLWLRERSNGSDGLGGIFPAMAGLMMAMPYLHLSCNDRELIENQTNRAIENLKIDIDGEDYLSCQTYFQPCVSPVWDTAISVLALNETLMNHPSIEVVKYLDTARDWLASKQISIKGDWVNSATVDLDLPLNGWAFQRNNDFYPDIDDTAMVIKALQTDENKYHHNINCGLSWLSTMQSKNGGYGAFDANNDTAWINDIPFADHKSMLDPPTADVSGRVLWVAKDIPDSKHFSRKKLIKFLMKEQETSPMRKGLWYGRWGTNYLWGTWSAVLGLKSEWADPDVVNALRFTLDKIEWMCNSFDHGYGESMASYDKGYYVQGVSNPFQTALALLTICELYNTPLVIRTEFERARMEKLAKRVSQVLIEDQLEDGSWPNYGHNAPGFPRVFNLCYHGYSVYFPLWALARYEKVFL